MSDTRVAIDIREATEADAEVIIEFNRRLAADTEDKALDPQRLADGVGHALSSADTCLYLVAEVGGQVVGQTMVTFEWSDWRNGWFWWIQSVYVHPDFRRRGIFRALHDRVRSLARAKGNTCGIRLYVEHENHAADYSQQHRG